MFLHIISYSSTARIFLFRVKRLLIFYKRHNRVNQVFLRIGNGIENLGRVHIKTICIFGDKNANAILQAPESNWDIIHLITASIIPLNDSGAFWKTIGEVNY